MERSKNEAQAYANDAIPARPGLRHSKKSPGPQGPQVSWLQAEGDAQRFRPAKSEYQKPLSDARTACTRMLCNKSLFQRNWQHRVALGSELYLPLD
jgi:hypothetical protein